MAQASADIVRALTALMRATNDATIVRAAFELVVRIGVAHPSVRQTAALPRPADSLYAFVEVFVAPLRSSSSATTSTSISTTSMLRATWPAGVRRRAARALMLVARVDKRAREPLQTPVLALLAQTVASETHAATTRAAAATLVALFETAKSDGARDVDELRAATCAALRSALAYAAPPLLKARIGALLALAPLADPLVALALASVLLQPTSSAEQCVVVLDVALAHLAKTAPSDADSAASTAMLCNHILPTALAALPRLDDAAATLVIKLLLLIQACVVFVVVARPANDTTYRFLRSRMPAERTDRFVAGVVVPTLAACLRADGASSRHELAVQVLMRLANTTPQPVKLGVDALDDLSRTLLQVRSFHSLPSIMSGPNTAAYFQHRSK
jgi:hypothetical protein